MAPIPTPARPTIDRTHYPRGPRHLFLLRRPSLPFIQSFLASQAELPFSYPAVGGTTTGHLPPGYTLDRTRIRIGAGDRAFAAARAALRGWRHFQIGWVEALPADTPVEPGQAVAILARSPGLWSLNACRILSVTDEPARFAFTYGTLPAHVEKGEERFLVELAPDGSLWYEILAFSRPNTLLAWLAYPYARHKQAQFRRESPAALARAVSASSPTGVPT